MRKTSWILTSASLVFWTTAAIASTVALPPPPAWDLNDVTYLLPLPSSPAAAALRLADRTDSGQALLPFSFLKDGLGALGIQPGGLDPFKPLEEDYQTLTPVAVRMDPCFKDVPSDPCRAQIRIVSQPMILRDPKATSVSAQDAAVHTFYDFSRSDFSQMLAVLQKWKRASHVSVTGLPLSVHPAFTGANGKENLTSFVKVLKTALAHAQLSRVAFMRLDGLSFSWTLQSYNVINGKLVHLKIFPLNQTSLTFTNQAGVDLSLLRFDGAAGTSESLLRWRAQHDLDDETNREYDSAETLRVTPSLSASVKTGVSQTAVLPKEAGDQLLRVADQSLSLKSQDARLIDAYFGHAVRAENPMLNQPGTVDCLSCHISTAVKLWGEKNGGGASRLAESFSPQFQYNLKNNSHYRGTTHNLRALGYINTTPQIIDRVIYESAAVADELNRL